MENEQLQEELYKAIEESEDMDWYTNTDKASKACASITLEHMKGFAEFAIQQDWTETSLMDKKTDKSTEQLIEPYFESLNK